MAIIPFKRRKIPYTFFNANYLIMGITLAVFLVSLINAGIQPYLVLSLRGVFDFGYLWQFVSYFFSFYGNPAGDIFNLVFNLIALLFFGTQVEREMGSIQYILFYAIIGVVAGLVGLGVFALAGLWNFPIFGPSVTVFAVSVAFAAFYPDSIIYLMAVIPLRAALLVIIYVAIDVVVLLVSRGPNILVHLVGFALAYLWMLVRYRRNVFKDLFR